MKTGFRIKIFVSLSFFIGDWAHCDPLRCDPSAPIAFLINAENGNVLFDKNGSKVCHPASTTKLATVFYALSRAQDLNQEMKVSRDAIVSVSPGIRRRSGKHPSYRLEFGGKNVGLKPGEIVDMKSLLYAVMIASGNDASNVLAENISGTIPKFLEELNDFLREIGCTNTLFLNPHGLPDPGHVTTAADLARIARYAQKNPVFREVASALKYQKPGSDGQPASVLIQTNGLLKPGKYRYPYATGIKTGWTEQAGYNLVASAENGERSLIAVVCNCDEISKRYRSAVQLFEAAFNEVKKRRILFSKEHDLFFQEIEGGDTSLSATLEEDVSVSFYPSEAPVFRHEVVWNFGPLPIEKGAPVGLVTILDQFGSRHAQVPLYAASSVLPTPIHRIKVFQRSVVRGIRDKKIWFAYFAAFGLCSAPFYLFNRKRLKSRGDGLL